MTIIVGKSSNLSQVLFNTLAESHLVSSYEPIDDIKKIDLKFDSKINIIFNNFQKSTALYDLQKPVEYMQRALMCTAQVLEYMIIKGINVEKILYTSSSSVYGNNIFCNENDQVIPMNIHASLKITNEKLVESFCSQHHIDFTICRIFNMYGGNDHFSIISKIIKAAEEGHSLTLFNNGNAIRDFIHVDDVVKTYKVLLETKKLSIVNIGTSNGISVKHILEYLKNHGIFIDYETIVRDELKVSTANTTVLKSLIPTIEFKDVETFILEQLNKSK